MSETLTTLWERFSDAVAADKAEWRTLETQRNFDAYIDARISAALGTPVTVKPYEIRQYCACVFDHNGQLTHLCGIHDAHFRELQAKIK